MKQYGFNFATDATKKQISVIYAKAKNGELKIEKWLISELYTHADFYGKDDNRSVEWEERTFVKPLIDAVFNNDLEKAQNIVDEKQGKLEKEYSAKFVKNANRELV